MSGHVHWRHGIKKPWAYIHFPHSGKTLTVSRYRGMRMYDEHTAWKLIHQMQGEVENKTFNPLKYTKGESNVIVYLYEWLEECAGDWTPGTRALYKSMVVNHIEPFFKAHPYQLNEVRKKCYQELKNHLESKYIKVTIENGRIVDPRKRKVYANAQETKAWKALTAKQRNIENGEALAPAFQPDYVKKVVDCLRSAMYHAFDCEVVSFPPPRMKKAAYQIPEREIHATTMDNQARIIAEIPPEHRPIYQFCGLHAKVRPAVAMVLKWEDYDPETDSFILRRGISYGEEVDYTKTKKLRVQPVHPDFHQTLMHMAKHRECPWSPYVFTCAESEHKHKRYSKGIFNHRWNVAAKKAGIEINLYHGTRHTKINDYVNRMKLSPEQAAMMAGHASVSTTMTYYGKVHLETERELMTGKVRQLPAEKSAPHPRLRKLGER